jgi:ABC-type polysaccharide transport system, permease component
MVSGTVHTQQRSLGSRLSKWLGHNWQMYVLLLPGLVWLIVFMYAPMYGILIAFKDYLPKKGIMGSPWAGLKYFRQFFTTSIALDSIRNTIVLSVFTLLWSFPIPIIFALLLNQLRSARYKQVVQIISFAPHFVSSVVVVSILSVLTSYNGLFNGIVKAFGNEPIYFSSLPRYFRTLYIGSGIWQNMGFDAIIYIAALAGVSPDLHEAAIVDGASKFQRLLHIDLPTILPTIIIMLILACGNIMSVGYEKVYLMQNGTNTAVSEVISTHVYKVGLRSAQFSYATAVGLFNSVVNFILIISVNAISSKVSDIALF